MRLVKCKLERHVHLASPASQGHRVNPAFSVRRKLKARPIPRAPPLSPTIAPPVSTAIIQLVRVRWILRLLPMARTTARIMARTPTQITIAAHVATVVAAVAAILVRVPMLDQAQMIATSHANRVRLTIPIPPRRAKPTARQRFQVSMANIPAIRHASPTGCSTIPATARPRLAPIPARLATRVVRWIARRDVTAIIAKSVLKARRRFALVKVPATA